MTDSERIAALESRVRVLEQRLAIPIPELQQPSTQAVGGLRPVWPQTQRPPQKPQPQSANPPDSGIARLLGIGGVVALLLAASYLVRLAIESGWLTPVRQIAMVCVLGVVMITVGLLLLRHQRRYASLLPAGGMAVLYLAVYGAHLGYGLVGPWVAGVLVGLLSLLALALGRIVLTDIFALLSALTAYSVPLLLSSLQQDPLGLAIYFSAWGLVYCAYSLLILNRTVYLVALHLGLVLFAALSKPSDAWTAVMLFQTAQLLIFGTTAVLCSIKSGRGMSAAEATAHAPALLIFYTLQYATMHEHVPHLAAAVAIASAVVVVALLLLAGRFAGVVGVAGEQLVASYVALVTFHAIYLESLPTAARHCLALIAGPIAAWMMLSKRRTQPGLLPLLVAAGLIYLLSGLTLLQLGLALDRSPLDTLMVVLFAVELYAAYWLTRGRVAAQTGNMILYSAHIMAANGFVLMFDDRLLVSVALALLAFVTMGLGVRQRDRDLGRSALLLLGVLTAKVLLADLSGSQPVTRILCLLVLGMTLYGAGLVYQRKLSGAS